MFTYPLVVQTDMSRKMKMDCQEICSSIMEKHSDNELVKLNHQQAAVKYFQCAKIIKQAMEERYGGLGSWQVKSFILSVLCLEHDISGRHWRELRYRHDL